MGSRDRVDQEDTGHYHRGDVTQNTLYNCLRYKSCLLK